MRFLLATEERAIPLLLTSPQGAESSAELVYFPAILRPVARALRGDRPVVMQLRLSEQVADRR